MSSIRFTVYRRSCWCPLHRRSCWWYGLRCRKFIDIYTMSSGSSLPRFSYSFSMSLNSFPTKAICLVALHIVEPARSLLSTTKAAVVSKWSLSENYTNSWRSCTRSAAWTTPTAGCLNLQIYNIGVVN